MYQAYKKGTLFEKIEKCSDAEKKKYLTSRSLRLRLRDWLRALTKNYKAELVFLPPYSQELAYTDGHTCYSCTIHKYFEKLSLKRTIKCLLALVSHEAFHMLYTDFVYWVRRIRSISKAPHLYKWLFNALEDARIERVGAIRFLGVKAFLLALRAFLFEMSEDDGTMTPAQKLLNNILLFATCGKVKFEMDDAMQEAFTKCRPHIIAGRRADSTEECDRQVQEIFNIVYPLVKEEYDMPENPTGAMSSNGKNCDNFKRNAGTGGADYVEYDEDNETSESEGEDSETSGGKSSKKSSSKPSSKSSKKSSTNGGSSATGEDEEKEGSTSKSNGTQSSNGNKNADKEGNGAPTDEEDEQGTTGPDGDEKEDDANATSNANGEGEDDAENEDGNEEEGESNSSNSNENEHSKQGGGKGGDPSGTSLAEQEEEDSERYLDEFLSGMASEYEQEVLQKAQDEKRMQQLKRDTTHDARVSCANPDKNNPTLYSEMVANARPVINHLISEMKKVITWNQDEVCRKTAKGFLDPQSLPYAHRGTCFANRIEKSEEADLFVSLLIDCSGSMSGARLMNTAATATIILEACSALKIPVSIKGFASDWSNCDIVHFWDYQYKNLTCKDNITQIYASGGTPLAEALRYERSYLSTVRYADKICFVLTDGAPNCTTTAISEYKQLCRGALVYGVAIGDDIPCLKEIFGEGKFIDARDVKTLPYQIGNVIKKNILR